MKHYEERLEADEKNMREHVGALAAMVVEALDKSIEALTSGDEKLASAVVLDDGVINRAMRQIDAMAHSFLAVHLPSGMHLRLVSSIIRINIILERMGDYAVTIARELVQLEEKPGDDITSAVESMYKLSRDMLLQSLEAFNTNDAELAKQTMKLAQKTITAFNDVLDTLVHEQDKRKVKDLFALFVVFHHLVRVSDQSKNICEDTVFTVTGETKAKKIYKVLFLDEDNSCLSQMAAAIGNKSYSYGGIFSSAGKQPAGSLHAGLAEFLGKHGIDVEGCQTRSLQDIEHPLDDYHVIVSLSGAARTYMDDVPFHTTLLDWDVGEVPEGDIDLCGKHLDDAYRNLALQIQDLMLLLRGDEPSKD